VLGPLKWAKFSSLSLTSANPSSCKASMCVPVFVTSRGYDFKLLFYLGLLGVTWTDADLTLQWA
jgi:hypothetical protein